MGKILNALGQELKEVIRYDREYGFNKIGEPILLTEREQIIANNLQGEFNAKYNALGAEVNITTLTTIMKKVSMQKFFRIPPADYLPVRVGEGAWSSNLLTYRSFNIADDFSTGIVNTGANNTRLAVADAGVDAVPINVYNWAKEIGWTIMDLEQASKAGNWDLVTAKEKARKTNWDLGIQQVAFLGLKGNSNVLGLLNQSGITTNTTALTVPLKTLTADNLSIFMGNLLDLYRTNCSRSAMPTHFAIPESDYLGLALPSSSTFPVLSKLDLMQNTFRTMTQNKNFQILPCAYGDAAYNAGFINKQCYALYNYEEESLRMDIPVDYTNSLANSLNNFSFNNVGYGQFTGALAYRPLELYYFQY